MTQMPLVLAVSLLLFGCSTSGSAIKNAGQVSKTVQILSAPHPEMAAHLHLFIVALESNGFSVSESAPQGSLALRTSYQWNGPSMSLTVALTRGYVPVVTATATNNGWGTMMDRGGAARRLAEAAAEEFDKQLKEFRLTTSIVQ